MTDLPVRTVGPIDRVSFVRWVGAIDDVDSAVHYDRVAAREQGYDDVFAPGMLQAAMLADHATAQFGAENLRSCRWRFVDVVRPGDVLSLSGTATEQEDGRLALELTCSRAPDDVVLRCWMTFVRVGRDGEG
jgi:acyl dehydratase